MLNWLKQLLAAAKARRQTDEAIANMHRNDRTADNRTPLDPGNDPWRT